MPKRKLITQLSIILALLVASSCNSPEPAPQPQPSDWHESTPSEQGINPDLLDGMLATITDQDLPITAVLIVRHGSLVMEAYPQSYAGAQVKRKLYSATKSFTSALIGIAIQEGFIESIDQKVVEFFPDRDIAKLDERKRTITIEHLLTMTPGYQWDMGDGSRMRESTDPVQFVLNKPMVAAPGEIYNYGDGASHLLSAILVEASGLPTLEFARRYLFEPLGITDVEWEGRDGIGFGGGGLHLKPRDMAKFGQLYLNAGRWGDQQIVPEAWVAQSTRSHFSGEGYIAEKGAFIDGYGYQWWQLPGKDGYYAAGMYEQRIYIVPELDMVVVFTANNDGADITTSLMTHFIYPAIEEVPIRRYVRDGFSFEYPFGMSVQETPLAGRESISDASGNVEFRSPAPFFELISVVWDTSEAEPNLEAYLEAVYAGTELTFFNQSALSPASLGQREMIYQTFSVEDEGTQIDGAAGIWYNRTQERVYVFVYAVVPRPDEQVDVLDAFWGHLQVFQDG